MAWVLGIIGAVFGAGFGAASGATLGFFAGALIGALLGQLITLRQRVRKLEAELGRVDAWLASGNAAAATAGAREAPLAPARPVSTCSRTPGSSRTPGAIPTW